MIDAGEVDLAQIADIKGLHDPELPWMDVFLLILAAVFILGMIVFAWIRRRKCQPLRPHGEAILSQQSEHWSVAVTRQLHDLSPEPSDFEDLRCKTFEMASLVRGLLEKLTGINATDLTRKEIEERVVPKLESSLGLVVSGFFRRAELIQFARRNGDDFSWASCHSMAHEMFELAKRREAQAPFHAMLEKQQ
jgi:hypothetical protein